MVSISESIATLPMESARTDRPCSLKQAFPHSLPFLHLKALQPEPALVYSPPFSQKHICFKGFLLSPCLSRPWRLLLLHQTYKSSIPHWSLGVSYPLSQDRRKETAAKDHFDASIITCIHPEGWLNSELQVRSKVLKKIPFELVYTPPSVWGFRFLVR